MLSLVNASNEPFAASFVKSTLNEVTDTDDCFGLFVRLNPGVNCSNKSLCESQAENAVDGDDVGNREVLA